MSFKGLRQADHKTDAIFCISEEDGTGDLTKLDEHLLVLGQPLSMLDIGLAHLTA